MFSLGFTSVGLLVQEIRLCQREASPHGYPNQTWREMHPPSTARQGCLFFLSILVEFSRGQDVISDVLGRVCVIKVNNLLLQHMSNNPSDIKVGWRLAQIAHIPRKNPTLRARARVRGRLVVSAIKPHEISTLPGPGRVSRFRSVCGCSTHPCISAEHQHRC